MSDETAGFAVTISAELDRFERNLRQAGRLVETTADGMDKSTRRAARSFETLEGKLDPTARAATRLDRDMRKVQVALEKGAIDTDRAAAAAARLNQQYEATIARTGGLIQSQQRAGLVSGRMGNAIQQAGFQVGDFAVQIASGQNPLRAFIQQGTQLISMFGPWGAVIGAAGAIVGALATSFIDLGDSAEEGADRVISAAEDQKTALEGLNRLRRESIVLADKLAGVFRSEEQSAAKRERDAAQAEVAEARARLRALQGQGAAGALAAGSEVPGLESAMARLEEAQARLDEINEKLDYNDAAEDQLETREWLADNTAKVLEDARKWEEEQARKGLETVKALNQERIREAERTAKELEKFNSPEARLKRAKESQGQNSLTTGQASAENQRYLEQVEARVAGTRDRIAEATKRATEAERDRNGQIAIANGLLRQAQSPMERYREQVEAIAAAEKEGAISAEDATKARQQAVQNLNRQNPLLREAASGIQGLARDMIDFGDNAESFGERASNAFRRLAERITETIFELQVLNPLLNEAFGLGLDTGGGSGSGGLLGSFLNFGGTPINPDGGVLSSIFHDGGVAGDRRAPVRPVPVRAFVRAPRYHGGGVAGFRPGEVPAVLQRGEEVLKVSDPRHRFNMPRDPGRGLRMGGGGAAGSTFIIDARGADRSGLARLEGMIRELDGTIEQRSIAANTEAARRAPGLFT